MNNCWTRKTNHTEGSTTGNTEYSCQHAVKNTQPFSTEPQVKPQIFGTGMPVTDTAGIHTGFALTYQPMHTTVTRFWLTDKSSWTWKRTTYAIAHSCKAAQEG